MTVLTFHRPHTSWPHLNAGVRRGNVNRQWSVRRMRQGVASLQYAYASGQRDQYHEIEVSA
jgi:hypothetical protein